MSIDLEGLRTFIAVAEAGGLTAATGRLGRTVPALSRRIARLEEQLGVRLFDRSTRDFRLTRAGTALLDSGRRVLDDLSGAIAVIREQEEATRREITIAAFGTISYFLLPRTILAFQERFPGTRIHIRELSSPEVIDAVARRAVDLGLAIKGPLPPGVVFTTLLRDPFVLVCTAASRFAGRRRVAWAELAGERLVGFSAGTINRAVLDRALHARGVRVHWHYEVQQLPTALGLIEQGLGLLTLPLSALAATKDPALQAIMLTRPAVERVIGLVRRRDEPRSDAITAFVDSLMQVVRGEQPVPAPAAPGARPAGPKRFPHTGA
jgi:DNA-binding transcriptional LysR family regulator